MMWRLQFVFWFLLIEVCPLIAAGYIGYVLGAVS